MNPLWHGLLSVGLFFFAGLAHLLQNWVGHSGGARSFAFEDPWLLVLIFLPPMVFALKGPYRQLPTIRFPTLAHMNHPPSAKARMATSLPLIWTLACGLLAMGLARPQMGQKNIEVTTEGVDIFMVVDASGSMQALDFTYEGKPHDRLFVVKRVAADFIRNRPNDRLGMVVFGDMAVTQCPLTQDHGVLLTFLDRVQIGMAGQATAIGNGIGVAVNRLKDLKAKSRVIILLTDGSSNAGDLSPEKATELARKFNVKIYTVGIGSNGQAPFRVQDPFFGERLIYQRVEMDEGALKAIAATTGGKYYNARNTSELESVYEEINKLEKVEEKVRKFMIYDEKYLLFCLLALALITAAVFLENVLWRPLP